MKTFLCLVLAVGYGFLYRDVLHAPLFELVSGLPSLLHDFIVILVFLPFWVFAALSVGYYMKHQSAKRKTNA